MILKQRDNPSNFISKLRSLRLDYNFAAIISSTHVLHADAADAMHHPDVVSGPPWIFVGKASPFLPDHGDLLPVKSAVLQSHLRDKLLSALNRNKAPAQGPHTPDGRRPPALKLLSVDDVPLNQHIMQGFLKRIGQQVDVAWNGQEVRMRRAGAWHLDPQSASHPAHDGWGGGGGHPIPPAADDQG